MHWRVIKWSFKLRSVLSCVVRKEAVLLGPLQTQRPVPSGHLWSGTGLSFEVPGPRCMQLGHFGCACTWGPPSPRTTGRARASSWCARVPVAAVRPPVCRLLARDRDSEPVRLGGLGREFMWGQPARLPEWRINPVDGPPWHILLVLPCWELLAAGGVSSSS
jgi:hypothetical protein